MNLLLLGLAPMVWQFASALPIASVIDQTTFHTQMFAGTVPFYDSGTINTSAAVGGTWPPFSPRTVRLQICGTNYLFAASADNLLVDVRYPTPSDDLDRFLWRYNVGPSPTGDGLTWAAFENVATGHWISADENSYISCDKTVVTEREEFVVFNTRGGLSFKSRTPDPPRGGGFISTSCDPKTSGCNPFPTTTTDPNTGWPGTAKPTCFNIIDAVETPIGRWQPVQAVQSPKDQYKITITYSDQLSKTQTNSLTTTFAWEISEGFELEVAKSSVKYSGSISSAVSDQMSHSVTQVQGTEIIKYCPEQVCDGINAATMYQWRVEGPMVDGRSLFANGRGVEFTQNRYGEPKCPGYTQCLDINCQQCKAPP